MIKKSECFFKMKYRYLSANPKFWFSILAYIHKAT